jgi:thioredoxin 1
MKTKLFTIVGFCYAALAIMAASGSIDTINRASIVEGSKDCMARENRGSDGYCERLPGLAGSAKTEGNPANQLHHGWLPLQAKAAQAISGETIATIVQEDRTKNFLPNCMILWTAEWCKSCEKMEAVVEELREDGYTAYVLDYDENKELAKKMGIRSLPTSIVWEDKKEVKRHVGVVKADKIKKTLKKNEDPDYDIF